MRNRAKCKLCNDIIESTATYHFVTCKCGQISIDGGPSEYRRCLAHDWANFVYLDDDETERPLKVQKLEENPKDQVASEKAKDSDKESVVTGKRAELMEVLKETLKNSENLPPHVRSSFVTYADLDGLVSLIYAILREDS